MAAFVEDHHGRCTTESGFAVSRDNTQNMSAAVTALLDLKSWGPAENEMPLDIQREGGNEIGHKIPDDATLITCPRRCNNLTARLAIPDTDLTTECEARSDGGFPIVAPDVKNGIGDCVCHRAFIEFALEWCKRNWFSRVRTLWIFFDYA